METFFFHCACMYVCLCVCASPSSQRSELWQNAPNPSNQPRHQWQCPPAPLPPSIPTKSRRVLFFVFTAVVRANRMNQSSTCLHLIYIPLAFGDAVSPRRSLQKIIDVAALMQRFKDWTYAHTNTHAHTREEKKTRAYKHTTHEWHCIVCR